MEALAKLVADITEFLVGGVLFLGSVALLAHVLFSDELGALLGLHTPNPAGGAITIVVFALVYAFGVIAEGLSRMLLEWRLTWLTATRFRFAEGHSQPGVERQSQPGVEGSAATKRGLFLRQRATEWRLFLRRVATEWRLLFLSRVGRDKCKAAIAIREKWRLDATRQSESLGNTIEAQLKRLRIERTFFLSSLICLLALVLDGNWSIAAAAAVLCAVAGILVEERFKRFLGTIARAHTLLGEGGWRAPDSGGLPSGGTA